MVKDISPWEQLKLDVNPYVGPEIFTRLAQGTVEDLTEKDDMVLRWHGLYRHRPVENGRFMLRLKMPGGTLNAAQAATVASLAERFSGGKLCLTTRQNVQLHNLELAALPAVFAELYAVGLQSLGACGDQVRNVVACPVTGIDPTSLLDTTPVSEALTAAFFGNPAFVNLPRKFKISVCGCKQHCVPSEINDLSFVAALDDDGRPGFVLWVGGGLSAQPVMAKDLGVWMGVEDVVDVASAAVEIFRDEGNRVKRTKSRIKYLINERGVPWFLEEIERRLGRKLQRRTTPVSAPLHGDHLGVNLQSDPELVYIGIPVPVGIMTSVQLQAIAEIAAVTSPGRVRLTHQQNLIIGDIPRTQLDGVLAKLSAVELPVDPEPNLARIVSCTGLDYCNKALVYTKARARQLGEDLDTRLSSLPISIRMSGCPNGCGQHAIADIGLQGVLVKNEAGEQEQRFDIWIGGGESDRPAFARRSIPKVRPEQLVNVISDLWSRYKAEAIDDSETFSAYARRVLWEVRPAV